MTENWTLVRHEYAERVGLQSLQMLLVAANATDRAVRRELQDFAERMSRHAQWLRDGASPMVAEPA